MNSMRNKSSAMLLLWTLAAVLLFSKQVLFVGLPVFRASLVGESHVGTRGDTVMKCGTYEVDGVDADSPRTKYGPAFYGGLAAGALAYVCSSALAPFAAENGIQLKKSTYTLGKSHELKASEGLHSRRPLASPADKAEDDDGRSLGLASASKLESNNAEADAAGFTLPLEATNGGWEFESVGDGDDEAMLKPDIGEGQGEDAEQIPEALLELLRGLRDASPQ